MKLGVSQEACAEIANNNNIAVTYATDAVSSPLPSRSGATARSGSSTEDVLALRAGLGPDHHVARCLRVLRHVWTAGGAVGVARRQWRRRGGRNFFRGACGAGRAAFRRTVEILQVPFFEVLQIQFIDRVCSSSCEQRQVSTGVAVLGQGC